MLPIELPGYEIHEKILADDHYVVCHGCRVADGRPVIVKAPIERYPSPSIIAALEHDYAITQGMSGAGLLQAVEVLNFHGGAALVTEDFDGESLRRVLERDTLSTEERLRIVLGVTRALAAVHARGVIHRSITPESILVSTDLEDIKLTNFGLATNLPREYSLDQAPTRLAGNLAYIAPEQTGRMNRVVDLRSDLYSLGVTMFEILGASLPFSATDPMALVHAHIAREAPSLLERAPTLPSILATITARLLAKTAEARYQSAAGLEHDLQRCMEALQRHGTIEPFELQTHDFTRQFRAPQRLHGRERERELLLETFAEAADGRTQLVLVSGPSGVGKSALVGEIRRPIAEREGIFATGKFDQLNRDVPYAALLQALGDVCRRILSERDTVVAQWRDELDDALGVHAGVVCEVLPEMALLLGDQPPAPTLGPAENQNRFRTLILELLRVFCADVHPLVLLVDDLQWADIASLELLRHILTDASAQHLLVLGAYRNDEVDDGHVLPVELDKIRRAGVPVSEIELAPLATVHVSALVTEVFGADPDGQLGALVHDKTGGNPYFSIEFLRTIHSEGFVRFDPRTGRWHSNLDSIRAAALTDNVVELMTRALAKLEPEVRESLQLAACIGARFDLGTLAVVCGDTPTATARRLDPALLRGLIIPVGDDYKYASSLASDAGQIRYRFQHDRVQQAAYESIEERRRPTLHLQIGRLIQSSASVEELDERIFEILGHLNTAVELIDDPQEREQLARLNCQAAAKAKNATAYLPAIRFLALARELTERRWDRDYALQLEIHLLAAQCAFLSGDFDEMERVIADAVGHTRDVVDKARLLEIRLQCQIYTLSYAATIDTGVEILGLLGEQLRANPKTPHVVFNLLRTKRLLRGRTNEDLESLPEMSDERRLAAMRVLILMTSAAYFVNPNLMPIITFRIVRLSLLHGVTSQSAVGFGSYALVVAMALSDFDDAMRYASIAHQLLDRFGAEALRGRTYFVVGLFVWHWKRPYKDCIQLLDEGAKSAMTTGDPEYAGYSRNAATAYRIFAGESIASMSERILRFQSSAQRRRDEKSYCFMTFLLVSLRVLERGKEQCDEELEAEDKVYARTRELKDLNLEVYGDMFRCMRLVHQMDYEGALEATRLPHLNFELLQGQGYVPVYRFYQGVAAGALVLLDGVRNRGLRKQLVANRNSMARWAEAAPANCHGKLELLDALTNAVNGRQTDALKLFEAAVASCAERGHIHEEALSAALAGRYCHMLGLELQARSYLAAAYQSYQRWGAQSVATLISERWPRLLLGVGIASPDAREARYVRDDAALDLGTAVKAARAISGEIRLSSLLERLMSVMVENAGAQRGLLVVVHDGPAQVLVEYDADNDLLTLCEEPLAETRRLSRAIAQYGLRSKAPIVLDDASAEGDWTSDPYVLEQRPRSVLAAPLIDQGRLVGLIYLENNRTAGAFTHERLELLLLLTSQAAISLDNARLYGDLEEYSKDLERKVEERTREIVQRQEQLIAQEKLASLGTLTAGIAHEIRNPLNFIANFSGELPDLCAELNEELEIMGGQTNEDLALIMESLSLAAESINNHVVRANGIVTEMMKLAEGDAGTERSIDLHRHVDDCISLAYEGQKARHPNLDVSIERDFDERIKTVHVNPQDLTRILINLLNNACEAMLDNDDEGSSAPQIRVSTQRLGDDFVIRVRDNGAGIEDENLEKIFVPFFTTKPTGSGNIGLGLSVSLDLARRMSGHLTLDSTPAGGCECCLTLPTGEASARGQLAS